MDSFDDIHSGVLAMSPELIVALVGLFTALVGVVTAWVSRRHEVIHRVEHALATASDVTQPASKDTRPSVAADVFTGLFALVVGGVLIFVLAWKHAPLYELVPALAFDLANLNICIGVWLIACAVARALRVSPIGWWMRWGRPLLFGFLALVLVSQIAASILMPKPAQLADKRRIEKQGE
jgi:hypothetical protein